MFLECGDSEFGSTLAFLNCHYAMVLYSRLQMAILGRFLPKRVNLRLTRYFDHPRKPHGFHFEQFHKKSARKPRQGGSNYRCCIPALAGFVSPQSIVPDG